MDFSTKINIPKSSFSITHQDKILLFGSCFAENIGEKLEYFGFKAEINPFGIIYNPISIFNNLNNVIENKKYNKSDLSKRNELYFSFDHHGDFSSTDNTIVLDKINSSIEKAHSISKESKYVFITLGTSFVYNHTEDNKIVANCHKIPNTQFEKRLLTIEEIIAAFDALKEKLKEKHILFTVSPVRHWRDGAVENQRSKSILIESIHQLISQNNNCFYFPAYEIMMDELRDYRYYEEDMLHPNAVAVKYIWQRFCETYFTENTKEAVRQIEKLRLMYAHRIKNEHTEELKLFEQQKQHQLQEFKTNFPDIELAIFD